MRGFSEAVLSLLFGCYAVVEAGSHAGGPNADIERLIRTRMRVWRNKTANVVPAWQYLVNDKLGAYLYAIDLGVPTPKVYACSRGLPEVSPEQWGTNSFVVKPLRGWNSIGVVICYNGYDQMSSSPITTQTLQDVYRLQASRSNPTKNMVFAPDAEFLVEEYLVPRSEGDFQSSGIPADFKFDIYDGKIIFMRYMERMWDNKGKRLIGKCITYYDGEWNVLKNMTWRSMCHADLKNPPPELLAMKEMALKIANGLGVYYRVDMFLTKRGPVLGELTPWPANGLLTDKQAFYVLAHWDGDNSPRAIELASKARRPDVLRAWETLSTMEKCERVRDAQKNAISIDAARYSTII